METRDKIRHIFNKNHIEILRVDLQKGNNNYEFPRYSYFKKIDGGSSKYIDETKLYPRSQVKTDKNNHKYVIERKKSPLGFYYEVQHFLSESRYISGSTRTKKILNLYVGEDVVYQLRYATQWDQNSIGPLESDLRPWDIVPGDKSFPDHMLNALVEDVTMLFNTAEGKHIEYIYDEKKMYYNSNPLKQSLHDVKREVFIDLFGSVNGPRFQTNDEKILAHGFDLKYSFRKDKENGK